MTDGSPKAYNPKDVEPQIHRRWIDGGAFDAEPGAGGPSYCIVIPPPNVTDALHLGHALNNTLQDILIRFRRMEQRNTLWMPGTDHAGIATQSVVEKRILAEEGRKRTDFGRGAFIERIQAWKDEYEARIIEQLKTMGCSCDWRRTRFTMDAVCTRAVRETFFRLFADGLIYRGKRLVNWDPATQTVLADDEVEHETVQGHFWYMQYPLAEPVETPDGTVDHVTVATTRPETMLGDTAVAMNPADSRAGALLGKMVRLPLVGRIIPIIADEHVVLPDPDSDDEKARFSTGFLKVTPAHDPDDYEIGLRHELPIVNVMAPDGTISDRHGWDDAAGTDAEQFLGMDRFEAREAIVEWFRGEKLLEDVREYTHEIGHSYRSHVPIEPYLSDQWYIAVKKPLDRLADEFGRGLIEGTDVPANSLAGLALGPLLDGRLKFTPPRYARTYQAWLENLRDWPISRQLWWGHRIPVWKRRTGDREITGTLTKDSARDKESRTRMEVDDVEILVQTGWEAGAETSFLCVPPGHEDAEKKLEGLGYERDPDVLDTWFSSALWPFSTLHWPDQKPELDKYYPGDVLCTAREIITLWVSRMVMMGQYCMGDIPFTNVFIHAMIQDGEGRKMSKSLGNGIDPLDIIDSHGADAMRFTLASMTTQTQDVRMPVTEMRLPDGRTVNSSAKFDVGRNFCNKLWNASRFAMMNLEGTPAWSQIQPGANLADTWILSRLNTTIRDVTAAAEAFRFNEMADTIYHFMWDDFCDWYLEIAKARIAAGQDTPRAVLAHALDVLLRLLHPICPFITEAIWEQLGKAAPRRGPGDADAEPMLARARWPLADAAAINPAAERRFSLICDVIRQCRNIRSEHNVPPGKKIDATVESSPGARVITDNLDLLTSQANLGQVTVSSAAAQPADAASVTAGGVKMFLHGVIDRDAEIARLTRQAETLSKGLRSIQAKLANEDFLKKAPPEVVQRQQHRKESLTADLEAVQKALDALK